MFAVNDSMKYPEPRSVATSLGCIREVSRKVASATRMSLRPRFQMADQSATCKFIRSSLEQFIRAPELVERLKSRHANIVLYMSGFGEDDLRPDEASGLSDSYKNHSGKKLFFVSSSKV
jgi:hypothetical protein